MVSSFDGSAIRLSLRCKQAATVTDAIRRVKPGGQVTPPSLGVAQCRVVDGLPSLLITDSDAGTQDSPDRPR